MSAINGNIFMRAFERPVADVSAYDEGKSRANLDSAQLALCGESRGERFIGDNARPLTYRRAERSFHAERVCKGEQHSMPIYADRMLFESGKASIDGCMAAHAIATILNEGATGESNSSRPYAADDFARATTKTFGLGAYHHNLDSIDRRLLYCATKICRG